MKLTIEFDADQAACIIEQLDRIPSLLDRFEAGLARREQLDAIERECHQLALEKHRSYQAAAPVEATTDPAPGHPELPLEDDTPNTDTDFVGHGYRKLQPGETIEDSDEYLNPTAGVWKLTGCAGEAICYGYSDNNDYHLLHRRKVRVPQPTAGLSPEAAKAIQAATDEANPLRVAMDDPVEDTRPRLIPEPGNHYFLRNGKTARIDGTTEETIDGAVRIGDGKWGGFYWRKDGEPCGSVGPEWDCVEVTPF